jgi:hypothetical protein
VSAYQRFGVAMVSDENAGGIGCILVDTERRLWRPFEALRCRDSVRILAAPAAGPSSLPNAGSGRAMIGPPSVVLCDEVIVALSRLEKTPDAGSRRDFAAVPSNRCSSS